MLKLRIKATILVFGVAMAVGIMLAVAIHPVSLNKVRIGGATYDTEANHSRLIADGLVAVLAGQRPDNLVNPEVLP